MSAPAAADADFLAAYAADRPGKAAVIVGGAEHDRTVTYSQLNAMVNTFANAMLRAGVQPGDRVAWCGRNCVEVLAVQQAARKLALTSVPLNFHLRRDELTWILDNAEAVMVWTAADQAALFEDLGDAVPTVREVIVFDGPAGPGEVTLAAFTDGVGDHEPEVERGGPPAGTIIYTSGTTGKPKGAVRDALTTPEQRAILRSHLDLLGVGRDDVYLPTGALHHGGPLSFADLTLSNGDTVVLQTKFDPEGWLRLLERYRANTSYSAPTAIRWICSLPDEVKARYDTSSMRLMIAGAASWPYALKLAYLDDFPELSLWELYGSTELGTNTILQPQDQRRKPGSCGQAAPGVEIVLLDDDGNVITEPHQPGELYVRGGSRFRTYYKDPEKFLAEHRGDLHTVGDIAYVDEEGFFYICDRKKDMIISGGVNVYPAEIEATLEEHPSVFESAVYGLPDDEWGERVHATVVRVPGAALTEDEVIAFCKDRLASYKAPRTVEFVDELPHSGSGKVLKRELRDRHLSRDGAG